MKQIDIQRPFESFDRHINFTENKKILFSAAFGSGKTYFLKKYFEEDPANKNKFNVFWLSPIRYVVSQNEDIFEYIKFDLANQLLKEKLIQNEIKTKYNASLYLQEYINNRPKDVIRLLFSILEGAPNLAVRSAGKSGNSLMDTLEKHKAYKEDIDKHLLPTSDLLAEYLLDSITLKGSIYEDDFISQLIRTGLDYVKESRQNVLIIDDFDRLDPEHIFRILNILTVHQDYLNGENKFGFDKIVIVCHLENIRHIYEHKYGSLVDFDGYIEKYYSIDVFRFSNEQAIALFCQSSLTVELNLSEKSVLGLLLTYFVNYEGLNIRNIVKHNISIKLNNIRLIEGPIVINQDTDSTKYIDSNQIETFFSSREFFIVSEDFEFLLVLKILINIFGDYDRLKNLLIKITGERKSHATFSAGEDYDIIKVFGPINLLIENFNQPSNIAVNYYSDNRYTSGFTTTLIARLGSPVRIANRIYSIDFGWTRDNTYDGQCSFFFNKEIIYDRSSITVPPNETASGITSQTLMDQTLNVLKFLESRNFARPIGLIA